MPDVGRLIGCVGRAAALAAALLPAASAFASELPRVASINLCADQLVLALADREQIATVSWLAADPHESMLAARAEGLPLNYGTAEELLRYGPDVVIAGAYTGAFTRALLLRLGYAVIELEPEDALEDIEANLRIVADAIGQTQRAAAVIEAMRADARDLAATRPAPAMDAVVLRPGGFTVGSGTLAHELMQLAGLRNVAAEHGLDRWGSLSMETLMLSAPSLLILTGYRTHEPSLANSVLAHRALTRLQLEVPRAVVPAAYWACGLPQSLDSVRLIREALR